MKILNVFLTVAAVVGCVGQTVAMQRELDEALFGAVHDKDIVDIRKNINRGANVNAKDHLGNTALYYVISTMNPKDRKETVKYLIQNGANPDIKNYEGKSARDLVESNRNLTDIADLLK